MIDRLDFITCQMCRTLVGYRKRGEPCPDLWCHLCAPQADRDLAEREKRTREWELHMKRINVR